MKLRTTAAVLLGLVVLGVGARARAQSLGEIAKKAAADKAAKAKAGTATPTKTITLQGAPAAPAAPPAPAAPVTPADHAKLQDALAALRAVQSVLDGGANAADFKRYYLEAKVKVDALPDLPDAAPLRAIEVLYADAITLATAAQVKAMSGAAVRSFKTGYATDYGFLEMFGRIPDRGFGVGPAMRADEVERYTIDVRFAGQLLLHRAAAKLGAIKP